MSVVPGMNIINKFADSLGMPGVNLNIRMCLFVVAPENQLLIAELRVVQYARTESDHLRYAPTRLAGSPMARDLENKRITRVMSLQRVGKVGGSSRSDTDGHDPSLQIPTRLAGSPMARDLENKRIYRIMSAVGRKSRRIESIGHEWTRSICDCVRLRETKKNPNA